MHCRVYKHAAPTALIYAFQTLPETTRRLVGHATIRLHILSMDEGLFGKNRTIDFGVSC